MSSGPSGQSTGDLPSNLISGTFLDSETSFVDPRPPTGGSAPRFNIPASPSGPGSLPRGGGPGRLPTSGGPGRLPTSAGPGRLPTSAGPGGGPTRPVPNSAAGGGSTRPAPNSTVVGGPTRPVPNSAAGGSSGRRVPNPGGRLGNVQTRAKTQEVINDLRNRGFTSIQTEVHFRTGSQGQGRNRFADVVGTNPQTGQVESIQIGRTLRSDNRVPIIRERRALDDIIFSPDIQNFSPSTIRFVDVNRPSVIQP